MLDRKLPFVAVSLRGDNLRGDKKKQSESTLGDTPSNDRWSFGVSMAQLIA
jgi:hypothetical protein